MSLIRVIAVEQSYGEKDKPEPVMACVYQNGTLMVYDTEGSLYRQREMFDDFESLEYYIKKGKYEWAYISIREGQIIYRNEYGSIETDGKEYQPILPFSLDNRGSGRVLLKLFYEFLKSIHKGDPAELESIKQAWADKSFLLEVNNIVNSNPIDELSELDRQIIVMSRILGMKYVINQVKEMLLSEDKLKEEKITFFFTRLFKLEKANYISIQ